MGEKMGILQNKTLWHLYIMMKRITKDKEKKVDYAQIRNEQLLHLRQTLYPLDHVVTMVNRMSNT